MIKTYYYDPEEIICSLSVDISVDDFEDFEEQTGTKVVVTPVDIEDDDRNYPENKVVIRIHDGGSGLERASSTMLANAIKYYPFHDEYYFDMLKSFLFDQFGFDDLLDFFIDFTGDAGEFDRFKEAIKERTDYDIGY